MGKGTGTCILYKEGSAVLRDWLRLGRRAVSGEGHWELEVCVDVDCHSLTLVLCCCLAASSCVS